MPGNSPTVTLTEDQIAAFHRDGFLAVGSITSPQEIETLREVYDDLFRRRAGRAEGNQFDLAGADEDGAQESLPQILNPRKYAPGLANTLYEANALVISRQLLGDDAHYTGDHAIFKPAGSGAATPWHQDEAYWDPQWDYCSLSVWMPLQEATLENGCMQFIPGSHKLDILRHRSIGGDVRIHGLELDEDYDLSTAVACPLPAGGATFHLARTLHYTGANRSSVPRRAYILGFGLPAVRRTEPRRFPWNEIKQTAREERSKASASRAERAPGADT